jgi:rod shape determining protein RodA
MAGSKGTKFDWITIFIYIALVAIGWVNIYSASYSSTSTVFFDFSQIYIKQLVWISLSLILIPFILTVEAKFY